MESSDVEVWDEGQVASAWSGRSRHRLELSAAGTFVVGCVRRASGC